MFTVTDDVEFCQFVNEILPAFERKASTFSSAWSGVAGGTFRPPWWAHDIDIPAKAFTSLHAKDVLYAPQLGIIATQDGRVSRLSMQQASYADPEMKRLAAIWDAHADTPIIERASIAIPWAAMHNYGHFLLDGLTSVPFLSGSCVTPLLQDWQRQHFALLRVMPHEIAVPLCLIREATYTSGFGQNLHNPNVHFLKLREQQRPRYSGFGRKLYISRKGHKRSFRSEEALIAELAHRGFISIQPETLPIARQISAFREADVIVAPTGAGLANCLYCKAGARVIEILPRDMTRSSRTDKWVAYLIAFAGADWRPYFCENDQSDDNMPMIGGIKRAGYLSFDVEIADLLAFIEQQ